jgi:DNA-binding CsgD family transcriptional regulator
MGAGNLILVNQPRCLPVGQYSLEDGVWVCGRARTCDLALANVTVSRRHAELRISGDHVEVVDLASRNGTFVGGTRIDRALLTLGQCLRLGEVSFLLSEAMCADDSGDRFESESTTGIPIAGAHLSAAKLSIAQRRVFDLLLQGLAEKEIAKALDISVHTAHNHVRKIYQVFGLHSRAELLAQFVNRGEGDGVTIIHQR